MLIVLGIRFNGVTLGKDQRSAKGSRKVSAHEELNFIDNLSLIKI
jgi:hypothetical protein